MAGPYTAFSQPRKRIQDPNNAFGSQIGRIGALAPAPMGPTPAGVMSRQALADYHTSHLGAGKPYGMMPGAVGARIPQTTPGGGMTILGKRPWTMPSVSSNADGSPSLLNGKPVTPEMQLSIAQNRARQGMSLDSAARGLLEKQPGGLASALAGGRADPARKEQARNLIVQRAQQQAAERQNRMAGFSPRASALLASGDSNARNLALGGRAFALGMSQNAGLQGMRDAQATLATAQADNLAQQNKRLNDPKTMQDAQLTAALESEDPAVVASAWDIVKRRVQGESPLLAGSSAEPPPGFTPSEDDVSLGLGAQDAFAVQQRRGDNNALAAYGRSRGWPQAMIDRVLSQYGRTPMSAIGDVLTGWNRPRVDPPGLVGPPALVGPPGKRRKPTTVAPRQRTALDQSDSGPWSWQ